MSMATDLHTGFGSHCRCADEAATNLRTRVTSIIEKAFQDVAFKITKPGDQADRYEAALRDIRRVVTDQEAGR